MHRRHVPAALAHLLLCAFALAAPTLAAPFLPLPQGPLPLPVAPPENPTTAEKVVLGKMLFWDEQLSSDGTMACGTCHQPSAGGADPRLDANAAHPGPDGLVGTQDDVFGSPGMLRSNAFGHFVEDATFGFDAQATDRNTPSMIAAAYFPELFWDGRAADAFVDPVGGGVSIAAGAALESQSLQPLLSDVEMAWEGRGWDGVTTRLAGAVPMALAGSLTFDMQAALTGDPTYPDLFEAAFGSDEITPVRIAFALAAYQRTLVPDQSKFDRVMRGQDQFTQAEQRGFNAFRNPGTRCVQCHSGSLFSDGEYHNLGLRPIAEDSGRQAVTGLFADRGRFKTPSLRNVELRERFFHTGAPGIDDLRDVMDFYNADGGPFGANKDPLLNGIMIPPPVRNDLVAFLRTLTDPRVAAEAAPFDRPTLWSERFAANPAPLGIGGVAGTGGFVPQIVATAPPKQGNPGFRVGLHGATGGSFTLLHVDLLSIPAGATTADLRHGLPLAQVVVGTGAGAGHATWIDADAVDPVLVGLTYEAQWWVRDAAAPGGIARSPLVRVTIE
ncbi:MAG: cytochrome c peroxidase [Planctomycetota bacterium]